MDHFLEGMPCKWHRFQETRLTQRYPGDTCLHAWEVLGDILKSEEAKDIVCDIGMSVHPYLIICEPR